VTHFSSPLSTTGTFKIPCSFGKELLPAPSYTSPPLFDDLFLPFLSFNALECQCQTLLRNFPPSFIFFGLFCRAPFRVPYLPLNCRVTSPSSDNFSPGGWPHRGDLSWATADFSQGSHPFPRIKGFEAFFFFFLPKVPLPASRRSFVESSEDLTSLALLFFPDLLTRHILSFH